MTHYWVAGGIYKNTAFDELAEGRREERIGPFDHYDDAVKEWNRRSWASVDNCHARYRIVSDDGELILIGLGPPEWK